MKRRTYKGIWVFIMVISSALFIHDLFEESEYKLISAHHLAQEWLGIDKVFVETQFI